MKNILSRRGIVFLVLFTVLALVGMAFNFANIIGSEGKFFTFFQFFGPIAGGFLGLFGIVAVLFAELLDFAFFGNQISSLGIASLLPMMFAAYYFSRNRQTGLSDKLSIIVPVAAMAIFWMHPIGQQIWYYPLYWTIPIIAKFLPEMLFLRSLGATFSAHCIGSAIWIWSIPMTLEQWLAVVPATAVERLLFAGGITVSYLIFTNILNMVDRVWDISKVIDIDRRYVYNVF